jgi:hypothetical protein
MKQIANAPKLIKYAYLLLAIIAFFLIILLGIYIVGTIIMYTGILLFHFVLGKFGLTYLITPIVLCLFNLFLYYYVWKRAYKYRFLTQPKWAMGIIVAGAVWLLWHTYVPIKGVISNLQTWNIDNANDGLELHYTFISDHFLKWDSPIAIVAVHALIALLAAAITAWAMPESRHDI